MSEAELVPEEDPVAPQWQVSGTMWTRVCRMEPAGLSVVEKWIRDRRSMRERKFDRLGDLLSEESLPDVDP
jgi:hypothetical protein